MLNQLKTLKETIRSLEADNRPHSGFSLGHAEADRALSRGLLAGTLHEVFASERHAAAGTGFALMLALRLLGKKSLLWVQQDFSALPCGRISPVGFLELGINPNRLILLRASAPLKALRAAADSISCKALGVVLLELWGESKAIDFIASRRLTLAAARSGTTVILLRIAASPRVSTAETRWMIEPGPSRGEDWGNPIFSATLLRNRHGRIACFSMEWSCDECIFREPTNSRLVVSDAADRAGSARDGEARLHRVG
jgi:protein ImuA